MLAEKKPLGVEELEAQTALELPDREMLAVLVTGDLFGRSFEAVIDADPAEVKWGCAFIEARGIGECKTIEPAPSPHETP